MHAQIFQVPQWSFASCGSTGLAFLIQSYLQQSRSLDEQNHCLGTPFINALSGCEVNVLPMRTNVAALFAVSNGPNLLEFCDRSSTT